MSAALILVLACLPFFTCLLFYYFTFFIHFTIFQLGSSYLRQLIDWRIKVAQPKTVFSFS